MPTDTFDATGDVQEWDVPADVDEAVVTCVGAGGASGGGADNGGNGAEIAGAVSLAGVSTLYVYVGEAADGATGGWPSGGDGGEGSGSNGGGGGGGTDVRTSQALSDRLLAAGAGGGGGGYDGTGTEAGSGGNATATAGEDGGDGWQSGGAGATQSGPGSGGDGGEDGSGPDGGNGAAGAFDNGYGGGGGGGYYGGGGGSESNSDWDSGGGGGGAGSTWTDSSVSDVSASAAVEAGDGSVTIAYSAPPENPSIDAERETEIDLSWDGFSGAVEYRLYRHDESNPYDDGTQIATVSQASYTDTGLTNGKQYHYQVTAVEIGQESGPSDEVQGATLCPSPTIDSTDPYNDRIELGYSISDDNPDGHVDVLQSVDGSMGEVVATVSDLSQTEYIDDTVTTGETYHYTLRRDTGDVTAFSQVEETATFRPVVDLEIDEVNTQSIYLEWESGASPWSGDTEVWRDRTDYDYDDSKGEQIGTLDDSARSYSDTGLHPNTAYTYTLVALSDNEGDATSDPVTGTTTGPDLPKTRTRQSEWTVEIRLDDRTLRPPRVGEPDVRPRANDLPEIRIPTTEGPWTRLDLTDGAEDMLVWYQGIRQPIEELERIEEADDGHVLVGRGGTSLLDRVQVEVDQQPVHELAQELITEHTPYTPVVDAPPQDLSAETIYDAATASAWANLFPQTDLSTIPLGVDENGLYSQQSCWTMEAEDWTDSWNVGIVEADYLSGNGDSDGIGVAAALNTYTDTNDDGTPEGDWFELTFENEHDIPAEAFGFEHRVYTTSEVEEVSVYIDDELLTQFSTYSTFQDTPIWTERSDQWTGALEAGQHTIRYETTADGGELTVDVVAPVDTRYDYSRDQTVTTASDGSNYLDGPEEYPELEIQTQAESLVLSAVAADLTTSWDDTSGIQEIAVSNDGGNTWTTSSNAETLAVDFDEPGASIEARLRFGRHGSQEATPGQGIQGQRVSSLELVATLDDTPLAVNQQWDTSIRDVLQDLANQAGAIWDAEWGADGLEVNWTFPGVREATVEEPLTTYDQATDVRERASSVVVVGSNAQQAGDRVQAEHGTSQDLQQANLVSGTEAVYDPDTGTSYQRDDDYELNYGDGTITTLPGGDIGSGQTVAVDYRYETRGRFETASDTSDREITRNITGLVSDRQCAIAARRIALELSEPLHEAEVGFTPGPKSWSIVDQLTVNALPFPGPYTPRETRTQGGEARARLGSRQSVEEIVSEISDQTERVARRE